MTDNYRKRIRSTGYSVLLGVLMIGSFTGKVHGQVDTNAKIKSLFIYSFAKYVEWPVEMREGDFIIGVLGDYPTLYDELSIIAQTKTKRQQNFKIANYKDVNEVGKCHILYIDPGLSDQLYKVIQITSGQNTLIVGDGAGLAAQGAGISFYVAGNKQRMELNRSNLEKYNLKISSQLVALARVVN